MWLTAIKGLFGGGDNSGGNLLSGVGELSIKLRESIKGKEMDPMEIIKIQGEINSVEAAHRNIFVSGWRPFIGWVAGVSLGCFYIPQFALASYLWVRMCLTANVLLPYPEVNSDKLMSLIVGMLGLGAFRTYEKIKGKAK